MKNEIEVRVKGKVVKVIMRVIEHQGQFIGPLFCRYNGKRVEVKFEGKGPFYIEE
jgi:hypothetical protein